MVGMAVLVLIADAAPAPAHGADHVAAADPPPIATAPTSAATPAPPERRSVPAPSPSAPSFEEFLERLVATGLRTAKAMAEHDLDAAHASDRESRALLDRMLAEVDEVHARALRRYTELPEPKTTDEDRIRQRVCSLAIAHGLEQMQVRACAGHDRRPLDTFVAGVLASLPHGAAIARELGDSLLVGKPYLGACHEDAVLELAGMAAGQQFDARIATRLLLTLWHNLEVQGLRSKDQTVRLALLWMNDANPAQRLAALEVLLGDERYRNLVLDAVGQGGDAGLKRALALTAAEKLAPTDAVSILERLGLPAGELLGPYLNLGRRAPQVLADLYRRRLADDVEPAQRAELIRSVGFSRTPEGLELAQFAVRNDPDPRVRQSGMFAVTAEAAETHGEQTIAELLDDPRFTTPDNLGAAVLALQNLQRAGMANAVDRLGQRLRGMAGLRAGDRENLERILAEGLPGGQTSR